MTKLKELINWFDKKNDVLIALSGGVDSALVAYAAYQTLKESALAVTADYKTLSKNELESAKKVCREIGIRHLIINYNELKNEKFVNNDQNRCFYCRSELSNYLISIAEKYKIKTIVDGTNYDDLDDFRPGVKALSDNGIQSPLVDTKFSKILVRKAAKKVGLSVYDRPSNSCLASRIPWGQRVTAERLARIEVGENIVKQVIGAKQVVRVRDLNGTAKIELDINELSLLSDRTKLKTLEDKLQKIGFNSIVVDTEGYKPGKINVIAD